MFLFDKSLWRGYLLQFEKESTPHYSHEAGTKILLLFFFLEGVLGPRLSILRWFGLPGLQVWIRVPLLLLTSLFLVHLFSKINFREIGLTSWSKWIATERYFFIQGFVLTNLIFSILFFRRLEIVWTHALWGTALTIFVVKMMWGFYQEVIYRGLLQTELCRRFGTFAGIFVTNLFFTFGPLHFYHFRIAQKDPPHLWIFSFIFAIGLFFGFLFKRSGNLWIIGVFHGLGDWYLDGLNELLSKI